MSSSAPAAVSVVVPVKYLKSALQTISNLMDSSTSAENIVRSRHDIGGVYALLAQMDKSADLITGPTGAALMSPKPTVRFAEAPGAPVKADTGSDDAAGIKERKKRAPMTEEAKAAMAAKRAATIAAKRSSESSSEGRFEGPTIGGLSGGASFVGQKRPAGFAHLANESMEDIEDSEPGVPAVTAKRPHLDLVRVGPVSGSVGPVGGRVRAPVSPVGPVSPVRRPASTVSPVSPAASGAGSLAASMVAFVAGSAESDASTACASLVAFIAAQPSFLSSEVPAAQASVQPSAQPIDMGVSLTQTQASQTQKASHEAPPEAPLVPDWTSETERRKVFLYLFEMQASGRYNMMLESIRPLRRKFPKMCERTADNFVDEYMQDYDELKKKYY